MESGYGKQTIELTLAQIAEVKVLDIDGIEIVNAGMTVVKIKVAEIIKLQEKIIETKIGVLKIEEQQNSRILESFRKCNQYKIRLY